MTQITPYGLTCDAEENVEPRASSSAREICLDFNVSQFVKLKSSLI